MDANKIFQWAVGIAGSLVTALVIWMATFFYSFTDNVESIAIKVHDRSGLTEDDVREINKTLASLNTKLDAAGADREDIKKDVRTIVEILGRPR